MLVAIVCYDRPANLKKWEDAWSRMDTKDCELLFVITGNFSYRSPIKTLNLPNRGMDIGALKRVIDTQQFDRLFWCPDDFLPMDTDLFQLYDTADLVGTFWSTETSNHIRSGGIALTQELAKKLIFPPGLLIGSSKVAKHNCYQFEHLSYNFYEQTIKLGHSVRMVDGTIPPDSCYWREMGMHYLADTNGIDNDYVCPF